MHLLGVDVDGDKVFLALINSQKKILDLKSFETSNVKQFYIDQKKFLKNSFICSALNTKEIIIKQNPIKTTAKKILFKSIPFQLKSCNILLENTITLPYALKKDNEFCKLLFYVTPQSAIQTHLQNLRKLDISPDNLSSESQGLNRFARDHFPEIDEFYVLHVGEKKSVVIHSEKGFVIAHVNIKMGFDDLLKIQDQQKEETNYKIRKIDFDDFVKKDEKQLPEEIIFFKNQIRKTFLSFSNIDKSKPLPLLITGVFHELKHFDHFLLSENSDCISKILQIAKPSHLPFAISIGIALDGLIKDGGSQQFRRVPFVSEKSLKKSGTSMMCFLFFSLIISFLLFWGSNMSFKGKERVLKEIFSQINAQERVPLTLSDNESLNSKIVEFEEKIKKETNSTPYLYSGPRVSSFINWIENLLINEKENCFQVLSFDYELKPTASEKSSKKSFVAKITMTMKIKSKEKAKQIFELINQDPFIDKSKKLTWEEEKSNYITSFYIKPINSK